jgi:TonB family protein
MNRLQKKCLIAAAGTHLLVLVVVLCSGFITSKPKADDSQLLDVIPATAIDAALTSGVKNATPPAPTPEPPTPVVKAVEPVKPPETMPPEDLTKEDNSPKPLKHEIQPDLKKVVRNNPNVPDTSAADAAKEKRLRDARLLAIRKATSAIKENSSSSTTVDMPGASSVAYANYASIVKSVYTQAWRPPDDTASDDANVKVTITIANDGRVISAHIVGASGDAGVDNSVQKTLDYVQQIAPFPDGATETERTYTINFNLKARRQML